MPRLSRLETDLSTKALCQKMLSATSIVVRRQWAVLWHISFMDQNDPHRAAKVAKHVGVSATWVRELVRAYNARGPAAIEMSKSSYKSNGRFRALDEKDWRVLEGFLIKNSFAVSGPEIQRYILDKFKIKVSVETARNYKRTLKKDPIDRSKDTTAAPVRKKKHKVRQVAQKSASEPQKGLFDDI